MTVKVLVADDHEVVRTGLASLLAGSGVKIVAEATNGVEAVKLAIKHKPDVALLDKMLLGEEDWKASLGIDAFVLGLDGLPLKI